MRLMSAPAAVGVHTPVRGPIRAYSDFILQRHRFHSQYYRQLSEDTEEKPHLGATPQTIVVSRDGTVTQAWTGAYIGNTLIEMESYLGHKLPGLVEVPDSQTATAGVTPKQTIPLEPDNSGNARKPRAAPRTRM